MNSCTIHLCGNSLEARGAGTLWWPAEATLVVSDLHLGKSERHARRWGSTLPPYEVTDTLTRLSAEIDACDPGRVICLGDSFDDDAAVSGLDAASADWIKALQSGRDWVWVTGNHDPAPAGLGGRGTEAETLGKLTFRHVADLGSLGEVSGHYHPKARMSLRGKMLSRRCFLCDPSRIVMPAFGTYTGGLDWTAEPLRTLMAPGAVAVLTGSSPVSIPVPTRLNA